MRKVEVLPYSPNWKKQFEVEKQVLMRIFGKEAVAVHHIGSTAIEGMSAKPVIDILIEVNSIVAAAKYVGEMRAQGYVFLGENGISGRAFFIKGGEQRTHHVHIFQAGNSEVARHLLFRDYLRNHLVAAQQYSELKQALAQKYPTNIEAYIEGKNDFIREIDERIKD